MSEVVKQLKEAVLILIIFSSAAAKADRPEKIEFVLSSDDTVVFLGGTNMVRLQRSGILETVLTHAFTAESKGPVSYTHLTLPTNREV